MNTARNLPSSVNWNIPPHFGRRLAYFSPIR